MINYCIDKIENRVLNVYTQIQPKERPRVTKAGITYTPQRTKQSETQIVKELEQQVKTKYNNRVYLGDLKVNLTIYKKDGKGRGDIDNLAKQILDACLKVGKKNKEYISGSIFYDDVDIKNLNINIEYIEECSDIEEGFKMEIICLDNTSKQSIDRNKRRMKKIKNNGFNLL